MLVIQKVFDAEFAESFPALEHGRINGFHHVEESVEWNYPACIDMDMPNSSFLLTNSSEKVPAVHPPIEPARPQLYRTTHLGSVPAKARMEHKTDGGGIHYTKRSG